VTGGVSTTERRVRVGVVGAGLIARLMHLHYLAELSDRYEVAAICDLVSAAAKSAAAPFGAAAFTDWRDLLAQRLDAVLVLTSGSHAAVAIAAARTGRHVFTEKPMSFSAAEGEAMVSAAQQAGVTLMVGYAKRHDPAFELFAAEAASLPDARFLRVTTLESPIGPYLAHYGLRSHGHVADDVAARLQAESADAARAALPSASDAERRIYLGVLLDTLVHELNTIRGVLGEPTSLEHAMLSDKQVSVLLRFGGLPVAIHWIDLPGIARYSMEFALYAPDRRITLAFPSPFLRDEPATLVVEAGEHGAPRAARTEEVVSYESGFKRELIAFHEAVVNGTTPTTSGADGLADVALCQAIVECHRSGRPVENPASFGLTRGKG
jgi:predicted dehydrogenase